MTKDLKYKWLVYATIPTQSAHINCIIDANCESISEEFYKRLVEKIAKENNATSEQVLICNIMSLGK